MDTSSERKLWEEQLLETGIFQWHYTDDGKILRMKGTKYLIARRTVWVEDCRLEEGNSRDLMVWHHGSLIEEILDTLPNDLQEKIVFNWDLLV